VINGPPNVYVDLSALLDLRLGILNRVCPAFATEYTLNGAYYNRTADEFDDTGLSLPGGPYGKLDQKTFKELGQKLGTAGAAQGALITKVSLLASQLALGHLKNLVSLGLEAKIKIQYNIFPLKLSQAEMAGILASVTSLTDPSFEVELINLGPDEFTFERAKEAYFAVIMYDYVDWVNRWDIQLRQKPATKTCLYVPKLFLGDLSSPKTQETLERETSRNSPEYPFEVTSKALYAFIPIQFVPVSAFCAALPNNPFTTKPA
jgi:hypothetical protein